MAGEMNHMGEVAFQGAGTVIAEAQIIEKTLA
jgi:hypothetical protein